MPDNTSTAAITADPVTSSVTHGLNISIDEALSILVAKLRNWAESSIENLAENFLAGLMLAVRKPFQVGDLIKSNDKQGFVIRLNLRNTTINDFGIKGGENLASPMKEALSLTTKET